MNDIVHSKLKLIEFNLEEIGKYADDEEYELIIMNLSNFAYELGRYAKHYKKKMGELDSGE